MVWGHLKFLLVGVLLCGPAASAQTWKVQPLTAGPDYNNPAEVCKGRLALAVHECQGAPRDSSCIDHPNPQYCSADLCMKAKKYGMGMATNPAEYCITSIPRTYNDPPREINSQSDRPTKPKAEPSQTQVSQKPVPIPTPKPAQQGQQGQSQTGNWQQEASQDLQQCTSEQTQAQTCCTNPTSCSSQMDTSQQKSLEELAQAARNRNDSASLRQLCEQSKQLNVSSSNVNTGLANVCYARHSSCSANCGAAVSKWQQRLNSCGANCDRSLVGNTLQTLQQKSNQCRSYSSLEQNIRGKSYAGTDNSNMARLCSSAMTASSDGESSQNGSNNSGDGGGSAFFPDLSQFASNSGSESQGQNVQTAASLCAQNPNAPGCYVPSPQPSTDTYGTSGGVSPSEGMEISPSKFNVDNFSSNVSSGDTPDTTGVSGRPIGAAASIPNGGATGVGGSSADVMANASTSVGEDLPNMLGSGTNPSTDILKGESSGGGYSNPAGHVSNGDEGSGFENAYQPLNFKVSGAAVGTKAGNYVGMDLKKYLPGQANDPRRGLAGLSSSHPDIGPMHVDLFVRVSGRLQTLCKLNRLLDCK